MTTADDDDQPETSAEPEYRVGYKKPPLETRFRPGVSGHPKGRPKGRRNLKHDLQDELSERITIREGDRQIRITKQRAMVKSTVTKAIKGDVRAQAKTYELLLRAFGLDDEVGVGQPLGSEDEAILARFVERLKEERK
jgi:hypothetical protein